MNVPALSFVETLNILPDAAVVVDAGGRICFANIGIFPLLGYLPEELLNQPVSSLVPNRYRAGHGRRVNDYQSWGKPRLMSARSILHAAHADGRDVPVTIALSNYEVDGIRYSLAVLRDATVTAVSIKQAMVSAETDELTQLGNRTLLNRVLKAACNQRNEPFALLYLDLCGFKPFNDKYGHHTGDLVLKEVARRITACVRPSDTVVRLGGDEFVILMHGLAQEPAVSIGAARIARAISAPLTSLGLEDQVTANIGCAVFPHDSSNSDELMYYADRSMYKAKRRGIDFTFHAGAWRETYAPVPNREGVA